MYGSLTEPVEFQPKRLRMVKETTATVASRLPLVPSDAACRETHDRLVAAGVPIVAPLRAGEKFTTFICADPDGYQSQVYWDRAERPS